MGSKISIIIILLTMIALAGVLIETPSPKAEVQNKNVRDADKTYETLEAERESRALGLVFENYPLQVPRYDGVIADVDFRTNPLAQNFKEIIERGVDSAKVNYAGAYSITTWSCGDTCQNSAIVDVRDGRIVAYGIISEYGLAFSSDSTLLIINPKENIKAGGVVSDYYRMNEGTVVFEAKEVSEQGILEDCLQVFLNARNTITNEVEVFSSPCKVPFGWEVISNTKKHEEAN